MESSTSNAAVSAAAAAAELNQQQQPQQEFHLPSYLLKTAYGEELQKRLATPSTLQNDRSITTKLSALGIMGNMPSRYLNADYDSELASIFSATTNSQSTNPSRDRNTTFDSYEDDDVIHDDEDEEDDDDDDEEEEEEVRNIHYADEMDIDYEDAGIRRSISSRSISRRNSRKDSRSSRLQSISSTKNPFANFKYSLPTKWEPSSNKSLVVANNGLTLKIDNNSNNSATASISKNYDYLVTKTDNSIPVNVGVFYFETKILTVTNNNLKNNSDVTIGFMHSSLGNVSKMPGLENGSYGFNGSDGSIIYSQSTSKKYNCKFGQGDIIGTGINFATKSIFYTKNGVYLGVAFTDINRALTPIIGLKNGNSISSNFGQNEFIFDIDGYIDDEKLKIYKKVFSFTKDNKCDAVNRINLNTDKEIPNVLQKLVSSYFNHLGYIDISKTFLQEIKNEQVDKNLIKNFNKIETISTIDENNLKIRQQIRKYLISGDIDSSIKLTNLNFPKVFSKNEEILFKLNCNKFIQLIKKAKIDEAIEFGQSLRSRYSENSKFQEFLNDIFSLLAFENPKESEFGYLLNDDEILKISDELNSEILKSLGKSSISNLEKLIKHNKSMLHILNDNNQLDSLLITSDDFGL